MSLFIRAQRFGSKPRLLRLRGLSSEFGVTEDGILCCEKPTQVWFRISHLNGQYRLSVIAPGFSIEGRALDTFEEQIALTGKLSITGEDVTLTFFSVSDRAESYAHSTYELNAPTETETPDTLIEARLAHLNHVAHLPTGAIVSVGSAETDSMLLQIDGVARTHCLLSRTAPGRVEVVPRAATTIDELPLSGRCSLIGDTRIGLLPAGISFAVGCAHESSTARSSTH